MAASCFLASLVKQWGWRGSKKPDQKVKSSHPGEGLWGSPTLGTVLEAFTSLKHKIQIKERQ